jgi:hypothetical protein
VRLDTAQVPPVINATESKLMSLPDVPTVPCIITVFTPFVIRKCAAVAVASMLVSLVIALAVAVPEAAEPNAVAEKVKVAKSVPLLASVVFVGAEPVRM